MKKISLILICTIISFLAANAQINSVDGFNYYDINHSAFTVDASCYGLDIELQREIEYWFTCFEIAEKVTSVFNEKSEDAQTVIGDYLILKDYFINKELGGEPYKWILMRPNDDVIRPVVVLTHGGKSSDATTQRVLNIGAYDYLQRGYAVIYFQSGTSAAGDEDEALADAGLDPVCLQDNGIDKDNDCFQQAVYYKTLFNRAAVQYTVAKAETYKLDPNALFISGFSGGGVGALYTALADENDFSDPLFQSIGDLNSLSKYPNQSFNIKATSTLAGGIIDPSSAAYKIGADVIDASDSGTRFLLLHGQDDTAVQPGTGPLQWIDPAAELPGSRIACATSLKEEFDLHGITNTVVINCSAGHSILSYPCEFNDDDFVNNPKFSIGLPPVCLGWALAENYEGYNYSDLCDPANERDFALQMGYIMMQIHDLGKINAAFFSQDVVPVGPARIGDEFVEEILFTEEINKVLPHSFPYPDNSNEWQDGHLEFSDRCLNENCTALYFDKYGTGNSILLLGDFLQISGTQLSNFNDDFTLEMKIKEIDHQGIGILLSHMTNLGQGFELYINHSGFLQFKKTVNGNASIIGDKTLLDGKCHHVAVQRSGQNFSIYLDGMQQGETKTWNISIPATNKMRIGNTSLDLQDGNNGFNGALNSFRLWDRVLAPSEFEQADLPVNTTNLVADFIFDQRFGQEVFSKNSNYSMILGNNVNNVNYDPRWMSDDVYCEFDEVCTAIIAIEPSEIESLSIRPNPSAGEVLIKFENTAFSESEIKISTTSGNQIYCSKTNQSEIVINIETPGLYIVSIQKGNEFSTRKIVIQ